LCFSRKGIKADLSPHELIGGAVCGLCLFVASALQQFGIRDTDVGKTAFITAMYVVIVPLYGIILRKKAPLTAWVGVALCTVGFYLLCIKDGFSLSISDLTVLACAFVFALQIVAADAFLPKCDSLRLSLVQFLTVSILSVISALIFESPISFSSMKECLPEIFFLAIGSSGIAYTCQIIGQKNTPPAVASIILSLESVFGVIASTALLGERMSAREYAGCAVVFAAVIISQLDLPLFKKSNSLSVDATVQEVDQCDK
jgi:drug/metabolite transporter (DMT)-like permease